MSDAEAIDPTIAEVATTIGKIDDNIKNNNPMYFAHVNILLYHRNTLNSEGYNRHRVICDKKITESKNIGFNINTFFTNFTKLANDDKVYVFNAFLNMISYSIRNKNITFQIITSDKSNILLYYSSGNKFFWNSKIIKPILINAKANAKAIADAGGSDTTTKAADADADADAFDFADSGIDLEEELAMIEKETKNKKDAASVSKESVDDEEKDDESEEEKQDETIKITLQTMLNKLLQYTNEKTEEQYKADYIAKNNDDGELFTYEEEKEVEQRVGGRTQKKKRKRVQNRRRQKTIKNKV